MNFLIAALLTAALVLTGCTSSTYGNTFEAVETNQSATKNRYKLKVYTGGFAGPEFAKKDLDVEAKKFMTKNPRYKSYKILSEKFELVPSGVTFEVEFNE